MAGHLDALPGVEIGEDLLAEFGDLLLEGLDFVLKIDIHRVLLGMAFEFSQFVLQLYDRLFKIKLMFHRSTG